MAVPMDENFAKINAWMNDENATDGTEYSRKNKRQHKLARKAFNKAVAKKKDHGNQR